MPEKTPEPGAAGDETLRRLVRCGACGLQYDASGLAAGRLFRCSCGETLEAGAGESHEAAVVRCSSCGAPRQGRAGSCGFCGADFTLHERDLHTICPGCKTRISDRSRFCHSCGLPIAPVARLGDATDHLCPACGAENRLATRALPEERLTVLECGRCAGLWVGMEAFRILEGQAQRRVADPELPGTAPEPGPALAAPSATSFYRPCPLCARLMHRRNYGRKSKVIVDTCAEHGIWFDHGELDALLRWIGTGRQRLVAEQEERERREREREVRRRMAADPYADEPPAGPGASLGPLVRGLLDLLGL